MSIAWPYNDVVMFVELAVNGVLKPAHDEWSATPPIRAMKSPARTANS